MRNMRKLSNVKRWGTIQTLQHQSVAEHSYNVTAYVAGICKAMGTPSSHMGPILVWALSHDLEEAITNDIPTPAKKRLKGSIDFFQMKAVGEDNFWPIDTDEMDETDFQIVKLADLLDAAVFLQRETQLGNNMMEDLRNRYATEVYNMAAKVDAGIDQGARTFVTSIMAMEGHQNWTG